MRLESKEPTNRTLSFGYYSLKSFMLLFSFNVACAKRCGVNKRDARTFSCRYGMVFMKIANGILTLRRNSTNRL